MKTVDLSWHVVGIFLLIVVLAPLLGSTLLILYPFWKETLKTQPAIPGGSRELLSSTHTDLEPGDRNL